jgi:hypothetical protein
MARSLGLVALAACSDPATDSPLSLQAFAVAGDHQSGPPGSTLPARLEVLVRNGPDDVATGTGVAWEVVGGGLLDETDSRTDADGRARARFTLGTAEGAGAVLARVDGGPTVRFSVEARRDPTGLPWNVAVPLALSTFDGSGEVVHPDHAITPAWSFGHELAITPYPNGNANFEIPSLFSSPTGQQWLLAPGVPNPVIPRPAVGYLSDPDLVSLPETGEVYLYYRQVTDHNLIYLVRSSDGMRWTAPELVIAAPNHEVISPAVVRRAPGDWWMWSVNGGAAGCGAAAARLELRRSADGRTWTRPISLSLTHDPLTPWHVDVQWIPAFEQFWALYNVKEPGGCTTPAVFLATSRNGIDWTPAPRPVLVKGVTPAFQDIVYRSTFEYRPATDEVIIWSSGARYDDGRWKWSAAHFPAIRSPSRAAHRLALSYSAAPMTFQ